MNVLPSKFKFQTVSPESDDPTQMNGRDQYRRYSAKRPQKQRFMFDLHFIPTAYTSAMELWAWLVAQGGMGGIWLLPNPLPQLGTGASAQDMRAYNAHGKGATTITVQSLTPNAFGVMLPGDFIRPTANGKAYLVQNVVDADVNGHGTVQIYPPLYHALSGNELVEFGDAVHFQVSLESDTTDIEIAARSGKFADPKIDVVEVG